LSYERGSGFNRRHTNIEGMSPSTKTTYFLFSVFTGIDRPTGTIAPREGSAAL